MIVLAPISVGELIDKITILQIKQERITDAKRLANVNLELEELNKTFSNLPYKDVYHLLESPLISDLKSVNEELWDIENFKRSCEQTQTFDSKFVESARQVYLKNDLRARIKKEINELVGSTIVEEKSY